MYYKKRRNKMMVIIGFIILQILFDIFILLWLMCSIKNICGYLLNHKEAIQKILDCLTKR